MHFPVPSGEDLASARQLLRNPWRYPSICLIGLLCLWEVVKWVAINAAQAVGLLPLTVFGVVLLMPLTMACSVWEEVALSYVGSFTDGWVAYRTKAKRRGRMMSYLGFKALIWWGKMQLQQLAQLIIIYYTAPLKAFWVYFCLVVFGFVVQWLGSTEMDKTKTWWLCFATLFKLYANVYLWFRWGILGCKACHPITRVAFLTTSYYIKAPDDHQSKAVYDEFAEFDSTEDIDMEIELECPVPYPLNLIFSSSSTVHLEWMPMRGRSRTLEVDHKFSTKWFGRKIRSVETDYQFQLLCCEFGRDRVFGFMRGVAAANEVLMENVDDISRCYSLQETITFLADPQNELIKKQFNEESWCC